MSDDGPAKWTDMPPGGTLALDLSSIVGWAYGDLTDALPTVGRVFLPQESGEGRRFMCWQNECAAMFDALEPSNVVMATILPLPALNNRTSAFQQITLRGMVYADAWRGSIAVDEISESTVRTEMLGKCRWEEEGGAKLAAMAFCRTKRLEVPDHNAADAAVLWFWFKRRLRKGRA